LHNIKGKSAGYLAEASVIAGLYAALTLLFAPISYGLFQVRIAEALTVLPALTPAAVPGLFIGCIIANTAGGLGIYDIVFGSLATLAAAFFSRKMRHDLLVPLPPILINGFVIGTMLHFLYKTELVSSIGWVSLGQTAACYILGYPLLILLRRFGGKIFPQR